MGPTLLLNVQSDIVVNYLQGKVSSTHTCGTLEHLAMPSISVIAAAPGGSVVYSPFVFPLVIQKYFQHKLA